MRNDLNEILVDLKHQRPLCKLSILERISRLKWASHPIDDYDLLSDLIIRITADLIVFQSDRSVNNKIEYDNIFSKIRNDIEVSGLIYRSEEFRKYFEKFCQFF